MTNTNQQQDGIEERAKVYYSDHTEFVENGHWSIQMWMASFARTETATITAQRDRLKEALRGVVDVLESQPSYESFHEYELSGTPDLCRRCGKYIDHAYHGNALDQAKGLLTTKP